MSLPRKKLGAEGELLAKKLLQNKGYKFVERNFRTKFGEVDLVFKDGDQMVFVEVKTRVGEEKGKPEESVTPHKIKTVRKLAEYFMQTNQKLPQFGRIDVVAIDYITNPPRINHIENVG